MWHCVREYTLGEFKMCMEDIKVDNAKLHVSKWIRSHFSVQASSDMLLNNLYALFS